jgi:hypothetical protein
MKSMARKVTTRMKISRDFSNWWKHANESKFFAPKAIIVTIIVATICLSFLVLLGN